MPIKIIENLITQGNFGVGKKAIIPTVKNKTPTTKLYKISNKFTPRLIVIWLYDYRLI
jgi:hypothetical protein